MKRFLLLILTCLGVLGLRAQESVMRPVGVVENGEGRTISAPFTAVWADVEFVEVRTIVGPYARYAQKLLGITVPVVNRSHWEVADITLGYKLCDYIPDIEPLKCNAEQPEVSPLLDENGFAKLGIDRIDYQTLTTEQQARRAADRIFEIRKCRYDLITGEVGENVFGAGLEVALRELEQMENQLLEMFVGKRVTSTHTHRYAVDASRRSCIVCRFDTNEGIMADDNLSGVPLIVNFTPLEENPTAQPPLKGVVDKYAVAARVRVTTSLDGQVYDERVMPIFQQGYIIEFPHKR